jgi:hypothetical protein
MIFPGIIPRPSGAQCERFFFIIGRKQAGLSLLIVAIFRFYRLCPKPSRETHAR